MQLSLPALVTFLLASSARLVAASPQATENVQERKHRPWPTPSTCTPSYVTTIGRTVVPTVVTITTETEVFVPMTYTFPYSCWTQTIATSQTDNPGFCGPPITACPEPEPSCTVTETFTQPCRNRCCSTTATFYTAGGCATCRTGTQCATSTVYVPRTVNCTGGYY